MVADILAKQVDFLKAQRPGDTFRVVVEEESLDGEILGYGAVLALEYKGAKAGRMRLFRFQEKGSDPTYYDEKLVSIPRSALTIPLYYSSMTSPFGVRMHPVLKVRKMHTGVDFSAPPGTPVWSCAEGQVTFAGNKGANGNLVSIRHESGLMSHYAHLQRIEPGIKSGGNVKRRQVIGYVGSTGRSTGPHLHWGITLNGKPIDPLKYRIIPGKKVAAAQRGALQSVVSRLGGVLDGIHIEPPKGELAVVPDNDEPMSDY
jgi:murein DD-endopeptidase MepM/ murein hydrolase activator NlpD